MAAVDGLRHCSIRSFKAALVGLLLVVGPACQRPAERQPPAQVVLRIGFGLATGQTPQAGLRQFASNLAQEGLITIGKDGRARPRLAESWTVSADGLTWRFQLKKGVTFHDGQPFDAAHVKDALQAQLPGYLGPPFADVADIRAVGENEIEFSLKVPSSMLIEGLDVPLQRPGAQSVGTGPFVLSAFGPDSAVMHGNQQYYLGKPAIDEIALRPYASVRAAWADMLRGQVDMLYEVGADAMDSLHPSNSIKVFTSERNYVYLAVFNLDRASLRDRGLRRAMNLAIDRKALLAEAFNGHGTPADGPVWPNHWARDPGLPAFEYSPRQHDVKGTAPVFTCLFGDASLERLALGLQKQLAAVGINLVPQLTSLDKLYERLNARDFDILLADAVHGPSLVRAYWFWHTDSPFNYGHFSSRAVDDALDSVRHAKDDAAYKGGVAAFQRAVVDDPPAIFLAWSERSRAVSTRFEVREEPGRDILSTLRLWKPVGGPRTTSPD